MSDDSTGITGPRTPISRRVGGAAYSEAAGLYRPPSA